MLLAWELSASRQSDLCVQVQCILKLFPLAHRQMVFVITENAISLCAHLRIHMTMKIAAPKTAAAVVVAALHRMLVGDLKIEHRILGTPETRNRNSIAVRLANGQRRNMRKVFTLRWRE